MHLIALTNMNYCLKSGIQKYAPNSRVHVQVLHWVRGPSFVDFSDDREDCFHARHGIWRNAWCGHYFLSALGFPKFSDLLDAPGFPLVAVLQDKSPSHFLFMEHVKTSSSL